jgi:cell wall-associated NlpC family hydrolase
MNRETIVRVAKSWLGTPYHHRAKIKGVGTDCGQILIAVFAEAGLIKDFDPGNYPGDWMLHRDEERYLGTIETYAKRITRDPLPGDIALFKYGRCISHGAIVTDYPEIIHAYKPSGCVILDNIETNEDLGNRLVGYWSVLEN